MSIIGARGALRRFACAGAAASILLAAAGSASAEDGLESFFASVFGGAPAQPAPRATPRPAPSPVSAPAPGPRRQAFRQRPLVVRLQPAKPRAVVAQVPAKVGPVSIFEDRTLRRGDAVMTRQGMRVFAGSASWPYRPADFVAIDAGRLDRDTSKVLAQLDRPPVD